MNKTMCVKLWVAATIALGGLAAHAESLQPSDQESAILSYFAAARQGPNFASARGAGTPIDLASHEAIASDALLHAKELAKTIGSPAILWIDSGEPTPEKLAAVRKFLEASPATPEAIEENLKTVAYKLQTFKTGFAQPVFGKLDSAEGNVCVVAVGHAQRSGSVAAFLTSDKIYKPLLKGRALPLDSAEVLGNIMPHESFHCYDMLQYSVQEVGYQIINLGADYYFYLSEIGADAYAALQYLQRTGDPALLKAIADYRTLNLLNGDAVHYTAKTLDYVVQNYRQSELAKLSTKQLVALADLVREETKLSRADFRLLSKSSDRLSRDYDRISGTPPAAAHPVAMQVSAVAEPEPSARLLGNIMADITRALGDLGGDVQHPIVRRMASRFPLDASVPVRYSVSEDRPARLN